MSKTKPYSPQLAADLLPVLYRERVARKVPMTKLLNHLIRTALRYEGVLESERAARVAETPCSQEVNKRWIKLRARRGLPRCALEILIR